MAGFLGNIVELWEAINDNNLHVDLGTDQTSLHDPCGGGYLPIGYTLLEAQNLMKNDFIKYKSEIKKTLIRHVTAINSISLKGMKFWDYGNAFLLRAKEFGADIIHQGELRYPSYFQSIMGDIFAMGFGPFRWVCTSSLKSDLEKTDKIAAKVLKELIKNSKGKRLQQYQDNLIWVEKAMDNKLVVGSQARILYSDAIGRMKIAQAFNQAIKNGIISQPIVLSRDHHDVSGTDSPWRETSNIEDGSKFTSDMAIQNVIGDSFRGATWVAFHNGGGVGWGQVCNGGFGMVLDGTLEADKKINMLYWDVINGVARRAWAGQELSINQINQEMKTNNLLKINNHVCFNKKDA